MWANYLLMQDFHQETKMFKVRVYMYLSFINLAKCKDNFGHDFIRTHGTPKRLLVIYTRFNINTGQTKKL